MALRYWVTKRRSLLNIYQASSSSASAEPDFLNLSCRNVICMKGVVNGGKLLNERQCCDLLRKLSRTVDSIQELVVNCIGSTDPFRPSLKDLYRISEKARVLMNTCRNKDNWITEAVFQIENAKDFQVILLEVGLCYHAIYEQAKEWSFRHEDLRKSSTFRPAPISEVREDQVALKKRLEDFASSQQNSLKQSVEQRQHIALAKYLLVTWEYISQQSRTIEFDLSSEILCMKGIESTMTSGNDQRLGHGTFGTVFKSSWLFIPCAKKVFSGEVNESSFHKEAGILFHLNHPHVVKFFCCGNERDTGDCFIAMELMDTSLEKLILDQAKKDIPFSLLVAVEIIVQIARAMCYLHGMGVAHRDLKPQNVVVNKLTSPHGLDQYYVKLVDFGLSKVKVDASKSNTMSERGTGTTRYRAPEAHPDGSGRVNWVKADTYSFAITCAHLLSLKEPFKDINVGRKYAELMTGLRPEVPASCPEKLVALLNNCWDTSPCLRPSFTEICVKLEEVKHELLRGLSPGSDQGFQQEVKIDSRSYNFIRIKVEEHSALQRQHIPGTEVIESRPTSEGVITRDMETLEERESENAGALEKPEFYLKFAEECTEAVQKMFNSREFNHEQCEYLSDKLEMVVQSARSFLNVSQEECYRLNSSADSARLTDIFKFLVALAKQTESFVQNCCKDAWVQAAMTLSNVSEYVSSLGFNLELCRIAFCKACRGTESLTLDEVCGINRAEVEIVEQKASLDVNALIQKVVTLTRNSLGGQNRDLAGYLRQRLFGDKPNLTSDDDWFLYDPVQKLGSRTSGTVHEAMWLEIPVAKKTFVGPENPYFLNEVDIRSQLCHPNVISTFCFAERNKQNCSIIMELMEGNLHELMERRCAENYDSQPFPILEAVHIMLQIGEGVNYLHSQGIVHMDLKSMSILFKNVEARNEDIGYVHVKVTNFEFSKKESEFINYDDFPSNLGTHRWMSPEIIAFPIDNVKSDKVSINLFKCDTYSFGMLCYEILTGCVPFSHNEKLIDIKWRVKNDERPLLPFDCPLKLKALIEKCWSQEPIKRPTFKDVCLELKYLKYILLRGSE